MGDAKHTPGPWRIIQDNDNNYNRRITSDHSPHIAKVYGWGDDAIYGLGPQANARLIAAAPEMLEALEDYVHAAFETGTSHGHNPVDPDGELVDRMRDAIRKAKGDSHG